jgi:uncharacterized protein (DUF58 family)
MSSSDFVQILFWLGVSLLVSIGPYALVYGWIYGHRRPNVAQWTILSAIALVGGILIRQPLIAVVATILLLAMGIVWFWKRTMLEDIEYERTMVKSHLFPGEETQISWTVRNNKPLPLSWLRYREAIETEPFGLKSTTGIEVLDQKLQAVMNENLLGIDTLTSISGFETVTKSSRLRAVRRGRYRFGPVRIQAADILGMHTDEMQLESVSTLTVFPQLFAIHKFDPIFRQLLGDLRKRELLEDPTWYRGARQYRTSDPMKSVDWRATARTRELHVKTFEPTVHPKLVVVANLHAFEKITDGVLTEHMEDVINTTASICQWAIATGFEVGLHSNGAVPGSHVPAIIPPSAEQHQLLTILDYLAGVMLIVDRPIDEIIQTDIARLPRGIGIVLVTSVMGRNLAATTAELARRRSVSVVMVDADPPAEIPYVKMATVETAELAAA